MMVTGDGNFIQKKKKLILNNFCRNMTSLFIFNIVYDTTTTTTTNCNNNNKLIILLFIGIGSCSSTI